ncbi:MAG: RHS repeat-associated core domain-containing protein, partial [Prevotella sp.]|nr:RHS repeat-associated core domain-containing protein [Prevotella sp.]
RLINWSHPSVCFYNTDHLGNVREVVDSQGKVKQVTNYYPFGMPYSDSTVTKAPMFQPYKYNGKELDRMHGLNWYDYDARMYDPVIGKWSAVDPLAEKYYNIAPYVYCDNSPVNATDPNGKKVVPVRFTDNGVSYYHSPLNVREAMDMFVHTSFGAKIMADFTNSCSSIFGVKGNGKYADYLLKIEELDYSSEQRRSMYLYDGSDFANAFTSIEKGEDGKPVFLIRLDARKPVAELVEIITHEFTVHLSNYEQIISAYEKHGDYNAASKVWNLYSAQQQHHDLISKDRQLPGTRKYYETQAELIKNHKYLQPTFTHRYEYNKKTY